MAEDKISNLYKTFVNDGYDMEPESAFRENLKDSKKRRAAYDSLVKDGYDMEPYEEFERNIGFGGMAPQTKPSEGISSTKDMEPSAIDMTGANRSGSQESGETQRRQRFEEGNVINIDGRNYLYQGLNSEGHAVLIPEGQKDGVVMMAEKLDKAKLVPEPQGSSAEMQTADTNIKATKEEPHFWKEDGMNIYVSKGGKRFLVPTKTIDAVGNIRDWQSAYDEEDIRYALQSPNGEQKWASLDELDELKANGWKHNAKTGELADDERLIDSWKRSYRVRYGDEDILLPYDDVRMYGDLKGWAAAHPEKNLRVYMTDPSGKGYHVELDSVEKQLGDGWRISKVDAPENSGEPTETYTPEERGKTLYLHVKRNGEDVSIGINEINEFGGFGGYAKAHPGEDFSVYMQRPDGKKEEVSLKDIDKKIKSGWKYFGETASENWQASTFGAISEIWKEAEKELSEERDKNARSNWGTTALREDRIVNASMNKLENMASEFRVKDLQRLMDKTWERSGKRVTEDCYAYLKQQYPNASDKEVWKQAGKMARQLSDQEVFNYAVAKNVPKSTLEYFLRQMGDSNTISSLMKGAARVKAGGKTGDMAAYEQAGAMYGKEHKAAQIGGSVFGMATDPTILAGGAIGNVAGKGLTLAAGKVLANQGKAATAQIGGRLFMNTTAGRYLTSILGGIGNLSFYEGVSEGARQFAHGGYINPETGENEGYSGKQIAKATGRGAFLGAGMGALGTFWGNLGERLSEGVSASEKALINADKNVASFLTEGAWFALPSIMEGEDVKDALIDSYTFLAGLKGQHAPKNVYKLIQRARPIKAKDGRPLTLKEINHNNKSFVERITDTKEPGLKEHNIAELNEKGYGDLAEIFGGDKRSNRKFYEIDDKGNERISGEVEEGEINDRIEGLATDLGDESNPLFTKKESSGPEFDGFSELERLMQDPNVSQETKAEVFRIVTDEELGLETVFGYESYRGNDGDYVVESKSIRGNVISRRRFKTKEEALAYQDEVYRQAELNTVGIGEMLVGAEHAKRIRGWIKDTRKVDIGNALKKREGSRSEAEEQALEEYLNTMYGEVAKERMKAQNEGAYEEGKEIGRKLLGIGEPESGENDVTLQHGEGSGQDTGGTDGTQGLDTGIGVAADSTGATPDSRSRGAIRVYEEGLASDGTAYSDDSERNRRRTESERLVETAKDNGQFMERREVHEKGERVPKRSGESEVIIDRDNHKVYKVKDPYSKSPMKPGVKPEDAIYEHLVHNKYFPETAYGFEGISEDIGDARIVLSQDYIESYGQPTQQEIDSALAEKGLYPEDNYYYGNDEIRVTDVTGDNAIIGADGKVYFIDPVIDFKKPVKEIVGEMEEKPSPEDEVQKGGMSPEEAEGALEGIIERMREAEIGFEEAFGTEADYYRFHLDNDPYSLAVDPALTPLQQAAVVDYIDAKAALDGVMEASNEAAQNKLDIAKQEIDGRTNRDSGMIEPAVMQKGDRPVYVLKGKVAMFADGSRVDLEHSSDSIVVMDAETGKVSLTSPEKVSRMDSPIDPSEQLAEVEREIEGERENFISEITEEGREEEEGEGIVSPESNDEPPVSEGGVTENIEEGQTAMGRIPVDAESGKPIWHASDPETTWDALVEKSDGNEARAEGFARMQLEGSEKAIKTAEKIKIKATDDFDDYARQEEAKEAAIAEAKSIAEHWRRVCLVKENRQREAERALEESRRIAAEEAKLKAQQEKSAREEAERIEKEALNGVPEWALDNPKDAILISLVYY